MDLEIDGGTWRVQFDDWLFLQANGVIINRARIRKWGFDLAEVSLFMQRQEAARRASAAIAVQPRLASVGNRR